MPGLEARWWVEVGQCLVVVHVCHIAVVCAGSAPGVPGACMQQRLIS